MFSYTPDMGILWYLIIFWLKPCIFSEIRFWKKILIFLGQNFFWNFFKKIFFAIYQPKKEFKAKKKISKNFKKIFWYKIIILKKLICKKTPSFSQKMMIYHKMPMSGVYENVFQTSEISILPSLSNELLFTLCLRAPSSPSLMDVSLKKQIECSLQIMLDFCWFNENMYVVQRP